MKSSNANQTNIPAVIRQLEEALNGGNAHVSFDNAVRNVPPDLWGMTQEGLPYSIWQLVEHIRITQWDILEFSRDPKHVSPGWPEGYWPKEKAPAHPTDWEKSLHRIAADRKEFIALLHNTGEGIYIPFSYGDGQSLFREAILIVDHTSYHTGEIILLRRLLKDWI